MEIFILIVLSAIVSFVLFILACAVLSWFTDSKLKIRYLSKKKNSIIKHKNLGYIVYISHTMGFLDSDAICTWHSDKFINKWCIYPTYSEALKGLQEFNDYLEQN